MYAIGVVGLLSIASCDDLMDRKPLNIISEAVVYDDPVLAEAYVANVYSGLSFLNRDGGGDENIDPVTQMSDEARHGSIWSNHIKWKAGYMDYSGGFLERWNYTTIRKANDFLVKIQNTTLPEATKIDMIARMRFARAILYFVMVERYGGVPIITIPQPIDGSYEELFVSRNKEIEVYDFIINEMNEIFNDLPSKAKVGYPSKWTAQALKSRAALYAASIATWGEVQINGLVGIPANEASRFWQASYDASNAIMQSKVYSLYNKQPDNKAENFRKLFTTENNSEVIFSWQLTGNNVGTDFDEFMSPCQFVSSGGARTGVYLEMVEEFENVDGSPHNFDVALATSQPWDLKEFFAKKDPRFHASVVYEGITYRNEVVQHWRGTILPDGTRITTGDYDGKPARGKSYDDAYDTSGASATGFTVLKYLDETLNPIGYGKSKVDFIVFRYGEILLNLAEAAFELGKTDEALAAVNAIRERAGMPLLTSITRDQIRHERKVELAFEAHRWWDLKRWRIAEEAITRVFRGIDTWRDAVTGKFVIEMIENAHDAELQSKFLKRHYYFPITTGRITNNPNLAPENPGY